MKKLIAVFLCVVMMATMIPSFFASAAALPADGQEVVAQNDASGANLGEAFTGFFELWGGLLKLFVGSDVWQNFLPMLKQLFTGGASISDIFGSIGSLWKDITG